MAGLFGISEDLSTKLARVNSALSPTEFRTRQLGVSLVAFVVGVGIAAAVGVGGVVTVAFALGVPLLVFLVLEQQVIKASEARQRRLLQELPVVAEQLGMLLASGHSLGGALQRLAVRGQGVIAEDLKLVMGRTRQGLSETQALTEWADLADVDALRRLVSVLALNNEATNLGKLISDEARAIRRDAHRELLTSIERKDQQVWVPVAIAALIPGSILIAIPFIQAMQTFSSG
ncbi:MAG: type II secretion system F family protein [Acidimicrobiales bacterium]